MSEEHKAHLEGSGAIAQNGGPAAGERGVVTTGPVHGPIVTGDHVTVTYQGAQVVIPGPESVAAHRQALRSRLEREARVRWGGMSTYIQEEGATLPVEASPYHTGRLGPRENLLHTLHAADRLLVLGEPGAGKTVTLERLAWELCGGREPAVPVLVRLFHYAGTPLKEWVRALLQETGLLRLDDERSLAAFLKEGDAHCLFLFDGLNEVPPAYRDRLVDELVRWIAAYPRHPVVLTCRPQDELWRRLRGEVSRAVAAQPIDDEQARGYLVAHLPEKGADLYDRLDDRLREMARTPLILWLVKEAGAAGESLPGNRGELYTRFVSRMLRRDTDRRMDAEIPERLKRRALADLAYHLGQGQRLTCPREEAVVAVGQQFGEGTARTLVGACARHGLLAGEETLWFAPHQTVQEHFAALALGVRLGQEWRKPAVRRWWRGVQAALGQDRRIVGLAADDWWAETFVQLAGLTDDADRLTREVAQANPWLALWCVEEGRDVAQATRQAIEARSVRLLASERVADRRRAVAALAQMRTQRAVRPLFEAAADADEEVAGLAAQTLSEMAEAVRPLAAEALQGTDRRLWHAALRCLRMLPRDPLWAEIPQGVWEGILGQSMVWVPPGPFLMGSDKAKDPQAYDDERPQHQVTLSGYWIGRTPVTNSQYARFVAEGRYTAPKHWEGQAPPQEIADHPVVYVSWHDALAYCRWLGEKTGLPVTLPSEAEWEKAARGPLPSPAARPESNRRGGGRIYPWGDDPPDAQRCNFHGQVGTTTPVGRYSPYGDSPYGCADMAGNVWQWTRSHWKAYPYNPADGRENLSAGDNISRVVRGGSFHSDVRSVRCAFRSYRGFPGYRGGNYGFRVVVVPPVPGPEAQGPVPRVAGPVPSGL